MTNIETARLPAALHLVATPIGHARDITLRALDILAAADVLAAEDTRALRRLMDIHGIAVGGRPLLAYHDHNGARMRPRLLDALADGRSVAYASEAGTPLISDPGFDLVRAAQEAGHPVTAAPGACAAVAALSVAGLPTDRFHFAGFLPSAATARRRMLAAMAGVEATLVFYESPHRAAAMLADAADALGPDRPAALCRELTKRFEETRRGTLRSLADGIGDARVKGEVVVLIGRAEAQEVGETDMAAALEARLATMSVRDAATEVARDLGVPRKRAYQRAMELSKAARREADGEDGDDG